MKCGNFIGVNVSSSCPEGTALEALENVSAMDGNYTSHFAIVGENNSLVSWGGAEAGELGIGPVESSGFTNTYMPVIIDTDGDLAFGEEDVCPLINSTGLDADGDGCIDDDIDVDGDGLFGADDLCPFVHEDLDIDSDCKIDGIDGLINLVESYGFPGELETLLLAKLNTSSGTVNQAVHKIEDFIAYIGCDPEYYSEGECPYIEDNIAEVLIAYAGNVLVYWQSL